jgi:hypothetical protein
MHQKKKLEIVGASSRRARINVVQLRPLVCARVGCLNYSYRYEGEN